MPEIDFILGGIEKKCEGYNHRRAHILNESYQAESCLIEHQNKILNLNKELKDLIEQEKELRNAYERIKEKG